MKRIGPRALACVKHFEGLKLTSYLCPAKVWTIGYGSTGPHVKPGMTINEKEAEDLLRKDLSRFESGVDNLVKGNATPAEYGAMVSLAFNIGLGAFSKSTVLKRHLAGDKKGAAEAFKMWNKGGGKVLKGLVSRREAESALYLNNLDLYDKLIGYKP